MEHVTVMKEQYISLETAKLAKEKGLSQNPHAAADNCMAYYAKYKDGSGHISLNSPLFNPQHSIAIAPTQSLLQKWLREEHKVVVQVINSLNRGWRVEVFNGIAPERQKVIWDKLDIFKTYENALEFGLQRAFKLI